MQREEPVEPPSKFVSDTHAVHMRCGLYYIDMEGLNDGRAVKTIVPQVNPRRLVSPQAREYFSPMLTGSTSQTDPRPRHGTRHGRADFGLQGFANHDERGLQPGRARDGSDRREHDVARAQSERHAHEHAQDGQGSSRRLRDL